LCTIISTLWKKNGSILLTNGFNDWKNAVRKVNEHENSTPYKTSTVALIEKGITAVEKTKKSF